MTKEELDKRVTELKNEREKINKLIYDAAMEYISSLPYKEGDRFAQTIGLLCGLHPSLHTRMISITTLVILTCGLT